MTEQNKKNLGELLAVDMPNGFTYIGKFRGVIKEVTSPLMLKEAITIPTGGIVIIRQDCDSYTHSVKSKYENSSNKEKEILIDGYPKVIHYLEQD